MDTSLKVFNWQEQQNLTTITDNRDGSLWFIGKEVCDILGTRTDHIPDILDMDEYEKVDPHTVGVNVNAPYGLTIISEPGLYSLILRSRKPEAKRFKRWVTGEVLPTIRKTGAYVAQGISLEQAEMAYTALGDTLEALRQTKVALVASNKALEEAQPKLDRYDTFIGTDKVFTFQEGAKMLSNSNRTVGPNKLTQALRDRGLLYKSGKHVWQDGRRKFQHSNLPKQHLVERGYFEVLDYRNRSTGAHTTQTKVTPAGLQWLDKLINQGDLVV